MAQVSIDCTEVRAFLSRLERAASGDFKKELSLFLEGMGEEFLRILQDEIIRLKVMDTRQLLISFHRGGQDGVWELKEGALTLEVGTHVPYAKYENDGHWTNPKGVARRFVPGHWEGGRFVYEPGAKEGMVLKMKWIEGSHYWESALRIFERIYPKLLDAKLQQWVDSYFSEFAR